MAVEKNLRMQVIVCVVIEMTGTQLGYKIHSLCK